MQTALSVKDCQRFIVAVLKHLEEKAIEQILSFSLKPLSSHQAQAYVEGILANKKHLTLLLHLEKQDSKTIKIIETSLDAGCSENDFNSQESLEFQDPKDQNKSFKPAVPLLPSFWGGGI